MLYKCYFTDSYVLFENELEHQHRSAYLLLMYSDVNLLFLDKSSVVSSVNQTSPFDFVIQMLDLASRSLYA